MEKAFQIGTLSKRAQALIIYSTNYLRFEDYIDELAIDLIKKSFKGNVILDLLLSNGIAKNRFIEVPFDGQRFQLKSLKILKDVDEDIKNASLRFYISHQDILNNGVLNKAQKFLIKKGL